ncbi:MAG: class I SAM-dependent methyltransferase [Cyclobacteriaceae bacterium]|nr:class I SAM-dependent methyltransferase [Cyclobacteriaceae bacterium]
MSKIEIKSLGEIQETLLIPLFGRALETQNAFPLIHDPVSAQIVEKLDYDFSKFSDPDSLRSLTRTTIRTSIIDDWVKEWLIAHPEGTVVELGCGLNTRFERVDNGTVRWFDLDMPDVFELWKLFFTEDTRRKFLPLSAFDYTWMQEVANSSPDSVLVVTEASVIYFDDQMVVPLMMEISKRFRGSFYLFDSARPDFIEYLKKNDALKYCKTGLRWTLEHPDDLMTRIPGIHWLKRLNLEAPGAPYQHQHERILQTKNKTGLTAIVDAPHGYYLNMIEFKLLD